MNKIGRPRKTTLSIVEHAFVAAYVRNGGCASLAAKESGLIHSEPSTLAQRPIIQQAIAKARERYIRGPLAGLALRALKEILESDATAPGVKRQTAKDVLGLAGIVERKPDDANQGGGLDGMSPAELEKVINDLHAKTMATPLIDSIPNENEETEPPTMGESAPSANPTPTPGGEPPADAGPDTIEL